MTDTDRTPASSDKPKRGSFVFFSDGENPPELKEWLALFPAIMSGITYAGAELRDGVYIHRWLPNKPDEQAPDLT